MNNILQTVALPAVAELGVPVLVTGDGSALVVPIPIQCVGFGHVLVHVIADEEGQDLALVAALCPVPESQCADYALLASELNSRFKFVTFYLSRGLAQLDCYVDLAETGDPRRALQARLCSVANAIDHFFPALAVLNQSLSQTQSAAEAEAEEIIRRSNI